MQTLIDNIIQMPSIIDVKDLTPKDFKPDMDVRWCAGCGGFSILSQTQRIISDLNIPKENFCFISGIGCSSRFPYYVDTYGMHTMHGRALPIATGVKVARPDLSVWVATGDGDGLSIGGNHFIHACRRNVDLNVMLFNNAIYSLTKGQYSPTSLVGQVTKSSPLGALDDPFNPTSLALGAGATFVARAFDRDTKTMQYMFERAAKHKGFAFVEVYANCVIFNDGAFDEYTKKETRGETTVEIIHGQPLIFGDKKDKGIRMDGYTPTVVSIADGEFSASDLLVHNEKDSTLAFILANMTYSLTLPRPMGIFQSLDKPTYNDKVDIQLDYYAEQPGAFDYDALLRGEDYWEI